jgi:hypothetical protein
MKTHVITVSRNFPSTHKRKGEETFFPEKILNAIGKKHLIWMDIRLSLEIIGDKLHTIRGNYPLWKKRIDEVIAGEAVLSIRYHTLGRYVKGNKQIEFCQLDKNSGVGVQKLCDDGIWNDDDTRNRAISNFHLAKNDSLSLEDFTDWFRKYDKSEPMAIIHFTPFRY